MIRITELERMDFSYREPNGKALPERPRSQESDSDLFHSHEEQEEEEEGDEEFLGTGLSPRRLSFDSQHNQGIPKEARTLDQAPSRRQSSLAAFEDDLSLISRGQHDHSQSQSSIRNRDSELSLLGMNSRDTNESTSWLDTIDESGASSPSSLHSKRTSAYLRRRKDNRFSLGTEAEFDAALDAAVEAAYDEGLEPAANLSESGNGDDIVANARRNIDMAKQKVREAEREAEDAMTRGREMRRIQEQNLLNQSEGYDPEYLDEEAEEEERLLEEMTRGYVMDDFEFSKSALPRQSDSSSVSGKTWESSAASNTTAAGAALSTLAEDDSLASMEKPHIDMPPTPLPTSGVLSTVPNSSSATAATPGPSVRDRRLSGQNAKGLKIETSTHLRSDSDNSTSELSTSLSTSRPLPLPKDEPQTSLPVNINQLSVPTSTSESDMHENVQNSPSGSFYEEASAKTGLSKILTQEGDHSTSAGLSAIPSPARAIGKVPSAPDNLGKQDSSSKAFRTRNVSVPAPNLSVDSPVTPSRSPLPTLDIPKGMTAGAVPILPTPTGANFTPNGLPSEGLYLFDSHIHSPTRPGVPNTMVANHPAPLEPCPDSFLLRPFWLMRCIYETIAHPSGGYLSTKLFVPRDVWRVKNAKIKAVEEKVSNCDLLTAALLKLSQVDKYDADAVLEEMQSLESVLDQVQTMLSKKLGGEVGVHGAMPLFKMSPTSEDASAAAETLPPKTSSGQSSSKSYLTSWRKLRSKNSGVGAATPLPSTRETTKDSLTISSLPMTPIPSTPGVKRDVNQLQFNGPNAHYMSALARLCDAAQVIGKQYLSSPHIWALEY